MADEVNENIFLVNAPAGSGKTTWIRQQVESYLLRNPKDNILCITYTNRAAEELGRDLEQSRVYFGTIHSFINDFIGSFFSHKEIIDLYLDEPISYLGRKLSHSVSDPLINGHISRFHNKRDIELFKFLEEDIASGRMKYTSAKSLKTLYTKLTGKT